MQPIFNAINIYSDYTRYLYQNSQWSLPGNSQKPEIHIVSQNYVSTNGLLWYHLFPAKCVSGLYMVPLVAGSCVLNRLRQSCKSACTSDVCFVNKQLKLNSVA
jgi:hypothetical protein